MPPRTAPVFLVAVAAGLVWAGPASASHPSPTFPGLSERELREAETRVLGERHAEEHARQRAHSARPTGEPAFGGSLSVSRLSGEAASLEASAALVEATPGAGAWGSAFPIPLFAIHAALLPSGKVLLFGPPETGFEDNVTWGLLWDPVSGEQERVDPPLWRDPGDGRLKPANIYCSGQAFLADGQLLVVGGTLGRDPAVRGLNKAYTFDPWSERWTEQPDMQEGRWYPTQVLLPDGRQVIVSGLDETGTNTITDTVEVFNPPARIGGRGSLTMLDGRIGAAGMPPLGELYPKMFAMPSGRTLVAGPIPRDSWYLETPGTASGSPLEWEDTPDPNRRRIYGNAVLEPPPPGVTTPSTKVVQLGGRRFANPDSHGSTATSEYFDESEPSPGWKPSEPYQLARTYQNTVLLPDGSMAAIGGGIGWPQFTGNDALKQVELWDPETRTWSLGAAQAETRAYHSVAVLLPDGRILSAGDNGNAPAGVTDTAEVYSPPYLFKGPRPTITAAPDKVDWGQPFSVATPDNIDRAVMIAPGATTHATDMHQRYVPLEITAHRRGIIDLVSPPNANAAPPGYYMLFLINSAGAPSIAKFIQIAPGTPPQDPPPPAPTPGGSGGGTGKPGDGSGTDDPGPGPGDGGGDTSATGLRTAGKRVQVAGRSVRIVVRAMTEDLLASVTGAVSVPRGAAKSYRLRAVMNRLVRSGSKRTFRLLVPKKARRAVRAFLGTSRRKRVKVRLIVSVRDSAGNQARLRRTVRLRR